MNEHLDELTRLSEEMRLYPWQWTWTCPECKTEYKESEAPPCKECGKHE